MDIFSTLFSNIWSLFLVIVFFGGSIFVHELGHFLAAKRRGLLIERFSIGFGPRIAGWTKDGIDYRISLLPLGGYVALPQLGDLDAIEGKSDNKGKLPPIGYADKMIVAVMGAVFNLITAFILATLLWFIGVPSTADDQTTTIGYVAKTIDINESTTIPGPGYVAGLLPGDKVLEVDGSTINKFSDIQQILATGTGRSEDGKPQAIFTIERAGKIMNVNVPVALVQFNQASGDYLRMPGISGKQHMIIGAVMEDSPAYKAGLKKGDEIIEVDGQKLYALATLSDYLKENPEREVLLTIKRDDTTVKAPLKAQLVPYTKPVGLITTKSKGEEFELKLLPSYDKKNLPSYPEDPKNLSSLTIFELPETPLFETLALGDKLESVNGNTVGSLQEFISKTRSTKDPIQLTFSNNGREHRLTLPSNTSISLTPPKTLAMIGIQLESLPLVSHTDPFTQFGNNIGMTFRTLWGLISPQSDISFNNLMGPPGIMRVLHTFSTTDLRLLIWFVVLLNINLAILNLLPIPVLDGGQMLFATISKLRGRQLSHSFIASTQGIFMLMLFSLMIYVSFFDIRRWQGDNELREKLLRQQELYIQPQFSSGK